MSFGNQKKTQKNDHLYKSLLNPKGVQVEILLELLSEIVYGSIGRSVRLGKARQRFQGNSSNGYTLTFEKGDTIRVLKGGPNESKWQGQLYENSSQGTFPSSYIKEKDPKEWTSQDVIEYVIKPKTKAENAVFCDIFHKTGKEKVEVLRNSTSYIIHSPEDSFYDLVHSLVTHLKGKDLSKEYVWIDVVCLNHNIMETMYEAHDKSGSKGKLSSTLEDYLKYRLHTLLSKFDECLIFFNKWNNPEVVRRCLNLWELYGALVHNKPVNVVLTSNEQVRMLRALSANYSETVQSLGQVNIRNSHSSRTHHRLAHSVDDANIIKGIIEKTLGHDDVNDSINQFLREWLGKMGMAAIHWRKKDKHVSAIDIAHLSNQVGLQLWSELEWVPEAERLFRESVRKYQKALGLDHKYVAVACTNLAAVLAHQGNREEAITLYKDAVVIRRSLPSEQLELARSLTMLAELLRDEDKFGVAEKIYHEVIRILKKEKGDEHVLVAVGYNNLAEMIRIQERFEEAELLFKEGLRIMRDACESHNFLLMAVLYNNLGLLYETQQDYEDAEKCYTLSLRLVRKVSGESHPDVALSLNNLASLLFVQEKYSEAEQLLRDSVKVKVKAYGKSHLVVAQGLENLAVLLGMENKTAEASKTQERALAILDKSLGKGHPRTRKCRNLLEKHTSKAITKT